MMPPSSNRHSIDQFMSNAQPWETSSLAQWKLKWEPFLYPDREAHRCTWCSYIWDTPNHPPQQLRTAPQETGLSITTSANDVQEQLTCNFTGSEKESGNDNLWYIGWLENIIWKNVSPSKTSQGIIGHNGAHISSPQQTPVSMHATCPLMTCEGVLNTSSTRETNNGRTKSPSFQGIKRKTDG